MEKQVKPRDMNFELLRIIAMLLIVALHYISHSGLEKRLELYSFNYIWIDAVKALAMISVNLYVLITGYYMIKTKMKIKKVLYIWGLTLFYSITMLIASMILGRKLQLVTIIKSFLPFSAGIYWFVTAYIALYILIPFINKLLLSLNKKQYQLLLIILFGIIVVVKSIFPNNTYIEPSINGNHVSWLIYVYMLGGYIRLYWNRKINKKLCFIIPLLIATVIAIVRTFAEKYFGINMNRLLQSVNILNFISMMCFFLYFKEIKITNEKINNIIGKMASSTFAIYLIHNNPNFRPLLWKKVMGGFEFVNTPFLILHFLIVVIGIFLMSMVIDLIRGKIFDLCKKTKIMQKMDGKLDHVNEKFCKIMEGEE